MAIKGEKAPAAGLKRVGGAKKGVVRKTAAKATFDLDAAVAETAAPVSVGTTAAVMPSILSRPIAGRSVKQKYINDFLRQLVMLLDAGTPLLRSLTILAERGEQRALRELVADIARHVENGNALWQAFERHPREFNTVFINLVKAGEASGTITTILKRLVQYGERREMLRRRVASAMWYPCVLVVVCCLVLLLIAKVVIPEFEELFKRLDVEKSLPWYTTTFIGLVKFVSSLKFILPVLGIIVVLLLLYRIWVRSPLNRLRVDRLKLLIPVIGPGIIRKSAVVDFTRSMGLLLRSGLSMMVTLDLVRSAIHNQAVAHSMQNLRDSVERGEGIEQPLRDASGLIPPVVSDMLVTGEESGQLDQIAEHIADTYEEEVNIAVSTIGDLLQPIITIFIGIVVLTLFLALFVPMITMLNQLMAAGAGGGAAGA